MKLWQKCRLQPERKYEAKNVIEGLWKFQDELNAGKHTTPVPQVKSYPNGLGSSSKSGRTSMKQCLELPTVSVSTIAYRPTSHAETGSFTVTRSRECTLERKERGILLSALDLEQVGLPLQNKTMILTTEARFMKRHGCRDCEVV